MEGDEGFLECMGWNGHDSPGEIFADLSLGQVNEMLSLEEAPGRVERGLQQITEVKILGSFSRRYSFCRVEDGRSG